MGCSSRRAPASRLSWLWFRFLLRLCLLLVLVSRLFARSCLSEWLQVVGRLEVVARAALASDYVVVYERMLYCTIGDLLACRSHYLFFRPLLPSPPAARSSSPDGGNARTQSPECRLISLRSHRQSCAHVRWRCVFGCGAVSRNGTRRALGCGLLSGPAGASCWRS